MGCLSSSNEDEPPPHDAGAPKGDIATLDIGMPGEVGDGGESWREEGNTGLRGADPSLVPNGAGGWTLFYKTFPPRG